MECEWVELAKSDSYLADARCSPCKPLRGSRSSSSHREELGVKRKVHLPFNAGCQSESKVGDSIAVDFCASRMFADANGTSVSAKYNALHLGQQI